MSTQMFFESVPDAYIDVKSADWRFDERSDFLPIILPRNYLNLYNFGFAQSRNLPQLSEGVLGSVSYTHLVGRHMPILRYGQGPKRLRGKLFLKENRERLQREGRLLIISDKIKSLSQFYIAVF